MIIIIIIKLIIFYNAMRHDTAMKACHCLTRLHYFYHFYSHRGDSFRTEFSHLGELRSIIPEAVKVMALTATATKASRREIIRSLDMQKPELITVPPVKHNIIYAVAKKSSIALAFVPLAKNLAEQRLSMGQTIIFCRRYDEVTGMNHFFRRSLGKGFTEPPGAPDMDRFRIVYMFTHCTRFCKGDYNVQIHNGIISSRCYSHHCLRDGNRLSRCTANNPLGCSR